MLLFESIFPTLLTIIQGIKLKVKLFLFTLFHCIIGIFILYDNILVSIFHIAILVQNAASEQNIKSFILRHKITSHINYTLLKPKKSTARQRPRNKSGVNMLIFSLWGVRLIHFKRRIHLHTKSFWFVHFVYGRKRIICVQSYSTVFVQKISINWKQCKKMENWKKL